MFLRTMGNTSAVMQNVAPEQDIAVIKNEVSLVESICDPRSPSDQFVRTPIEIKQVIRSTNIRSRISQPAESLGSSERGSYTRIRLIPDDPRSPTLGIVRTPIQVFSPETKYTETDESPISLTSATSEDYETGSDALSSLDKDINSTSPDVLNSPKMIEKQPKAIAHEVFVDEDVAITTAITCPTLKKQNCNDSENEICVKLFHTPPAKASALKERMPLRVFSANESLPRQILRAKQAREILKNTDVENTPPKGIPDTWTRNIPSYLK